MLLKHSTIYLLARGLPGATNLLALGLYTRLLSPDDYGQYALVIAAIGFANAVLFQWLRLGLLRFLPAYQDQREVFLSTVMVGFIGLVGLTGILGIVGLFFMPNPGLQGFVILGTGFLWVQAFFELNLELSRSELLPWRYSFLSITKAMVAVGLGGSLAYLGFGAFGLLFGLMAGMLFPMFWLVRQNWRGVRFCLVDAVLIRQLLAYGLPLTATFAFGFVVTSSDRFLLAWFLGSNVTGRYAVGYDLAQQTLGMLMMIVNLSAYPLAIRALEQRGEDAAGQQLLQNAVLLLTVALPSAAGLALLAPNIADVLLGQDFRDTATVLMPWIALGALFAGVKAYYFDLSFQLGRCTMSQVWIALVAAIVNIVLNLWWIPHFGFMGAAYATVAAYAAGICLSYVLGRRVFALPFPVRDAAKIVLATVVMVLVLSPLSTSRGPWMLVVQIISGALVFGISVYIADAGGIRNRLSMIRRNMGRGCE